MINGTNASISMETMAPEPKRRPLEQRPQLFQRYQF